MSEDQTPNRGSEPDSAPDPETSPFRFRGVAGMPYKRGSKEDLAIKRVIREVKEAREARPASD
jgi:hypothetical protein